MLVWLHIATGNTFNRWFNDFQNNAAAFQLSNLATSITYGSTTINNAFDANGNQISEGSSRSFEWDFGDRMRAFAVGTSVRAAYLYDAGGQRVKKIVRNQQGDSVVTLYIDGGFEHLYKLSSAAVISEAHNELHVMDGRSRIAVKRVGSAFSGDSSPAMRYNLEDHLGNSSFSVDSSGSLISREEYFPFGETSFGSYSKKRYRYNGKERDEESGLYYYGARYYAPWACRFVSVDPLAGQMPFSSPYSYAANNPVVLVDVDGLAPGGGGETDKDGATVGQSSLPEVSITDSRSGNNLGCQESKCNKDGGLTWSDLTRKTSGVNPYSQNPSEARVAPFEIKPKGPKPSPRSPQRSPNRGPFRSPNRFTPRTPAVKDPGVEWLAPGILGTVILTAVLVFMPTGSSSTNNVVPQPGYYTDPFNPPTEPEPPTKEKPKDDGDKIIALGDDAMLDNFTPEYGIPFRRWEANYDFEDSNITQEGITNELSVFDAALIKLVADPKVKFNFLLSLSWFSDGKRVVLNSETLPMVQSYATRNSTSGRCVICEEYVSMKALQRAQPGRVQFWILTVSKGYMKATIQ